MQILQLMSIGTILYAFVLKFILPYQHDGVVPYITSFILVINSLLTYFTMDARFSCQTSDESQYVPRELKQSQLTRLCRLASLHVRITTDNISNNTSVILTALTVLPDYNNSQAFTTKRFYLSKQFRNNEIRSIEFLFS